MNTTCTWIDRLITYSTKVLSHWCFHCLVFSMRHWVSPAGLAVTDTICVCVCALLWLVSCLDQQGKGRTNLDTAVTLTSHYHRQTALKVTPTHTHTHTHTHRAHRGTHTHTHRAHKGTHTHAHIPRGQTKAPSHSQTNTKNSMCTKTYKQLQKDTCYSVQYTFTFCTAHVEPLSRNEVNPPRSALTRWGGFSVGFNFSTLSLLALGVGSKKSRRSTNCSCKETLMRPGPIIPTVSSLHITGHSQPVGWDRSRHKAARWSRNSSETEWWWRDMQWYRNTTTTHPYTPSSDVTTLIARLQ